MLALVYTFAATRRGITSAIDIDFHALPIDICSGYGGAPRNYKLELKKRGELKKMCTTTTRKEYRKETQNEHDKMA